MELNYQSQVGTDTTSVYESLSGTSWKLGNIPIGARKMTSISIDTVKDGDFFIYKSKDGEFPPTDVGTVISFWFMLSTVKNDPSSVCFTLVSFYHLETKNFRDFLCGS